MKADGWGSLTVILALVAGSLAALGILALWEQVILTLERLWEFRVMGTTLENAVYRYSEGFSGVYEENGFSVKIVRTASGADFIELESAGLKRRYTTFPIKEGGED